MVAEKKNSKLDRLNAIADPLEAARQMHQDWLTHGIDFVNLYVEDVEGDWLENWDEDEEDLETEENGNLAVEKFEKTTLGFLKSDDPVAVKVRDKLKEKSLVEIVAELEKAMMVEGGDRRLFAVKNILVGSSGNGYLRSGNAADENDDEIEMLELAEDLLDKLVEIL
ncbi:MAG: hypothetical protein SXA11_01350 [Cyanobacteriota bacterium]|nr:hypothetical protein [Cyanobacteriota bacterium]